MSLISDILLLPSFYLFIGLLPMPIIFILNGKKELLKDKGYIILLAGSVLISVASFLSLLIEFPVEGFLNDYRIFNLSTGNTVVVVLYLPAVILLSLGLSVWLPEIRQLSKEIIIRENAQNEMAFLLNDMKILAQKAEAANLAKSEFLATMSHELRTPLNAIIGFAEALNLPDVKLSVAKQSEYIDIIAGSGKHLLSLINDILDLRMVEEGKLELNINVCSIREEFSEVIKIIEFQADNKNINLITDLENLLIKSDCRIIKQILLNILSNAIKFSLPESNIYIKSHRIENGTSISIQDQGIGMTAKELSIAMEPFAQVENTYNRTIEGSGLGLALVKRFVELIKGKMEITSVKNEGTLVTIEIINLDDNYKIG